MLDIQLVYHILQMWNFKLKTKCLFTLLIKEMVLLETRPNFMQIRISTLLETQF